MTSIATGIDLVEIKRFSSVNPAIRERFMARVFTLGELQDCAGKDASLAGRFVAKEAAAKALGCGIGEISWQEIEIQLDRQRKPMLRLHGKALDLSLKQGWTSWSVSISHTSELAIASVTALLRGD